MNRQRRLVLTSLLSICVGLALACGGGGKKPVLTEQEATKPLPVDAASTVEVDRLRKVMEDAEAEAELIMGKAGLSDAEKRHIRWCVGSGTIRRTEPADDSGPIRRADSSPGNPTLDPPSNRPPPRPPPTFEEVTPPAVDVQDMLNQNKRNLD